MRAAHAITVSAIFAASLLAAAWGCTLNPQPLPPDQPADAAFGGAADDAATRSHSDASSLQSDASSGVDAGQVPPGPYDGGAPGLDAGGGEDAGSDAALDGEAPDGAIDAASADAGGD